MEQHVVVFPTPPFWFVSAIIFAVSEALRILVLVGSAVLGYVDMVIRLTVLLNEVHRGISKGEQLVDVLCMLREWQLVASLL